MLKKFSDFTQENIMEGDKLTIANILNKEIVIMSYRIKNSKYSKSNSERCLSLQFELNEEKFVVFTGSNVLIDQIEKYKDEIPFLTTIIKIDKYFTFS